MLSTVVQDSVAQTLKQKTEEQHLALETFLIPQLNKLTSTTQYAALLKAFYGYFKPVEAAIAQYVTAAHLPDIKERRKSESIISDLSALQQPVNGMAVATELPQIVDLYSAMGALYVLEGSTLGGRGITKMLLNNTQLQLQSGQVQFFEGYGAATGIMWTNFLQVLNRTSTDSAEVDVMVTAANATFYYFKNWLQKVLIHGEF